VSVSRSRIIDSITEVARLHLGWTGELRPEMYLVEDLELDSIKRLTLALEVENHFRICLDEEAAILTVGDLVEIIRERLDE
jgi:acyl carrier protein